MYIQSNIPSKKDVSFLLRDKYHGIQSVKYKEDVERLATGEPLAYVIGWVPFLGLHIGLSSHPLIPRPETEWWTEMLLTQLAKRTRGNTSIRFLDMCAGSGAIGCAALAKLPNAHVSFGEIDSRHRETIDANVRDNALDDARTNICIGDIFTPFEDERFHIIAANPPYIPQNKILPIEVEDFEPELALRGGSDGLTYIRRLAKEACEHLEDGGEIWVEIDETHAERAVELFISAGMHTRLYTDPYGRKRLIVAY